MIRNIVQRQTQCSFRNLDLWAGDKYSADEPVMILLPASGWTKGYKISMRISSQQVRVLVPKKKGFKPGSSNKELNFYMWEVIWHPSLIYRI